MSYLAEHLVVDILVRLPASSVIRFGCVCKSWYSLIRNPNFMLSHSAICKNNQQYLVHKYSSSDSCDTISMLSDSGEYFESQFLYKSLGLPVSLQISYSVAGSCNGILCFVQSTFYHELVLFNPSIKHCVWLPNPKFDLKNHYVGFGFDIATKDFKILKFGLFFAIAEIYSLNSNSWRDISVPKFCDVFNNFGVFVNGALHWVVRMNQKNFISVFDVKDETFRQIALPSCIANCNPGYKLDVIEFGGSSIAVTQQLYVESVVWVMTEYGVTESWMHLATICRGNSKVLTFGDKDQVFIRFGSSLLAAQKLNVRAVKNLMDVGQRESFSLHTYEPSLFLLDKQNNNRAINLNK